MGQRDSDEKSSELWNRSFRNRIEGSFALHVVRWLWNQVVRLANWRSVYLLELALVCVIVWLMLTMHTPAPFYGELPVTGDEK
jgi:hypothetical protein